jgi:catechol 2,3-dioxygenase-like lactoylglutathione lyase family enzyme
VIQHVALEVGRGDADADVAFWAVLGLAEFEPPPGLRGTTRWVQAPGGTQVHLLLADDPVAPPQGHAAVVARAYEETLAALRAAGHAPESRREHWGAPRAFVRTPSGHRVEVMAAPPPGAGA